MRFSFKKLVFNKNALKRIIYIYIPFFILVFLILTIFSFLTEKPENDFVDLNQDLTNKIPIVYNDNYNIEFFGLEEFHPFDSKKYRHVFQNLLNSNILSEDTFVRAGKVTPDLLEITHHPNYLQRIQTSWELAKISELGFLRFFPSKLSRNILLEPKKYQSGGSVLAAKAALEKGWSINLGGGFHHASYNDGEGFCVIADISMIIKYLKKENLAQKFMIIDLDAHQGNGHGLDFVNYEDVYIFDAYNKEIYPNDLKAKAGIDFKLEFPAFVRDQYFLKTIKEGLEKAFLEFQPDLIIYVAGTDILSGDKLGAFDITETGIIERDEFVFRKAKQNSIPIVMLLSGGYQKSNASVITNSIINLNQKGLIKK